MRSLRHVISLLALFFVSACSEAIPTVTDLSAAPVVQTAPTTWVGSSAGTMTSTNYKLSGKIMTSAGEMTSANFKIISTGGDN